jgi:hypothetical protein
MIGKNGPNTKRSATIIARLTFFIHAQLGSGSHRKEALAG